MKKFIIITILACSIVGIILYFNNKEPISMKLTDFELLITGSNDGQEVSLKDSTDFRWDSIYIFTPYSNPNEMKEIRGMNSMDTSIKYNDTINLLVFVEDLKVIKYVEIPRNKGDFSLVTRKEFKANEAVFITKKSQTNITLINKY